MNPEWSARAFRSLQEIELYLRAEFGEEPALEIVTRIAETVDLLEQHPRLGRESEYKDRRELVVNPYVVLYSVHRDGVRVHSIVHGSRRK